MSELDWVKIYCNECESNVQGRMQRENAPLLETAHEKRTGHTDMVYRDE